MGEALETLVDLTGSVDLVVLDGWDELYLPLLRMLEGRMSAFGMVIANLSAGESALSPYLGYVRDPRRGYSSFTLRLDGGIEISVRQKS